MSIEDGLRERFAEMSSHVPGGPSLQGAIQQGRARRRRRAVAAFGSGVATVCAVGVVGGAAMTGVGPFGGDGGQTPVATTPSNERTPTLAVPPEKVNGAINDAFYAQAPDRIDVPKVIGRAYDENFVELPEPSWEQSVNWVTTFSLPKGERVVVSVLRSGPGANDTAEQWCDDEIATGHSFHCDSRVRSNGTEVLWSDRRIAKGDRARFERQVEMRSDEGYLVRVEDVVRASTYKEADARWTLGLNAMTRIATDDDLVKQRSGN